MNRGKGVFNFFENFATEPYVLDREWGVEAIEDMDLANERYTLPVLIGREPTDQELVIYLQHPNDSVKFFKFEEEFGQVYVLPPSIFYRRDGFDTGEKIGFRDHSGKEHMIEVGPSPVMDTGETIVYLSVDHHQTVFTFRPQATVGKNGEPKQLTKEEILDLAKAGDVRSPFSGNIVEISVKKGQGVLAGDRGAIMEAMKMQTPILSEISGIVTAISAKSGDSLKPGDTILKVDIDQ